MLEHNKYLVAAYRDYMQARAMVRCGMLGNAALQRENLRNLYRTIAGK